MNVNRVRRRWGRRGVLLMLATAASWVGLFGVPGEARAAAERWDGKWDTNWGNVRFFQDGSEIDGRWECNCPDGRKAVIDAFLQSRGPGPAEETVRGGWKCPGAGPEGRGDFRITADFDKKKRFRGRFWADADSENKQKWVGDKE